MDFNRVVLQHKKEYMVKKWRYKSNRNGVFPHYVRFITEKRKNLYPSFKKSPLLKMNGQFMFDKRYSRYYSLQQYYRKYRKHKIRFLQVKLIERVLLEFYKIRYGWRLRQTRKKSFHGLRFGYNARDGFAGRKRYVFVRNELLRLLSYNELKSLGEGPFTDTSEYHLNYPTLALNFHRCFLNQYNEFLFMKDEKANTHFMTLNNYLNNDKYIHDVLYTMPGARWSDNEVIEPIEQGLFELKNFNFDNSNLSKNFKSDLLEIEYINELNTELNTVEGNYVGSYIDISLHIDPVNTKFFLNPNLKYDDEKPAMWKAIMRVWYAYERERILEINDDYYYIYRAFPYAILGIGAFFPAFYTSKKFPKRIAGYKPWAKKPRYVPYLKTLYLPFQTKRIIRGHIRAEGRLNLSIFTKFIVFSFFLFIIFL